MLSPKRFSPLVLLWLGLAAAPGFSTMGASVAQWDFNGNLASSTGGLALTPAASPPASAPGVVFTNVTIGGQSAQAVFFTRGTCFQLNHGLGANGGGSLLNRYTVVMDVMFPSRPSGWGQLWQTNPSNSEDGEWYINPSGGVGISGNYGGFVVDGTWNRLALVVDNVAGTYTSYVNGARVQQNTGLTVDGRFAVASVALLVADDNQENSAGFLNSVQLRPDALPAEDIAALGAATATGIPVPQPPTLHLVSPNGGEQVQAGSQVTISWQVINPSGLVQIDLYRSSVLQQTLAQVPMRQSNYAWTVGTRLGDASDYRIRLGSVSLPSVADFSDNPFTIFGSGPTANPLFGQPLQTNGGFESILANWETVVGRPVAFDVNAGKGSPHSGARYLHGGTNSPGDTILRQDIDLLALGFTEEDITLGALSDAEAWLRNQYGAGTFDDQAYLRIAYLDAEGAELASDRCMVAANGLWVNRQLGGLLPTATRRLRVELIGRHRRDRDNDSMADDVVVRLHDGSTPVTPQITKLPMLQDVRTNAMRLLWETDGNLCRHAVDWGRSNVTEHTVTDIETLEIDSTHYVHRATIPDLEAESSYVYRVRSGGAATPVYSFRTPPKRDTPFAVAWWGDNHQGTGILRTHVTNFLAQGVNLIAVAGDMVNSGNNISEWHDFWFKPLEALNCAQTTPVIFARGNHDGEHALAYAYSSLPGNEAWFAFDYGNTRFIFLDSETDTASSPEQYQWLQAELARPETQRAAFRVACFHRPPFVNLWNGGGYIGEPFVRTDWVPLLAQGNVDLAISGHAHNYNRGKTNGVTFVISGGGGGTLDVERVANWGLFSVEYSRYHYGLMEINGGSLLWQAFDNNNQLLDLLTLKSRNPELTTLPMGTSTDLRVQLSGRPGMTYVLEQSTDLANWAAVATNALPLNGSGLATNTLPRLNPSHFLRVQAR
jgi:predicted phosphodiesterase